jgi:hypothetical protein
LPGFGSRLPFISNSGFYFTDAVGIAVMEQNP